MLKDYIYQGIPCIAINNLLLTLIKLHAQYIQGAFIIQNAPNMIRFICVYYIITKLEIWKM